MKKPVPAEYKQNMLKSAEKKRIQNELELKLKHEGRLVQYLAFIVAAIGFLLYANTLGHDFTLDDYSLILENTSTKKGFAALGEIFRTSYRYGYIFTSDEIYRPLSKAMFAIEWQLFPNNAMPGHWVNVILYSLTGFILTITLFKYFRSTGLAFISALLFISHPVHTEVVANIKSRDEILALLCTLLALLAMNIYTERKKIIYVLITALCFFLALLSKESAVTFLGVFAMVWLFAGKERSKDYIKPLIGIAAVTVLFFLIRSSIVGTVVSVKPSVADNLLMSAPDIAHRLATAIYIAGLYVKQLFFPVVLAFDYSFNQIPVIGPSDWKFIVSFIVLSVALVAMLLKWKSKSPWVFGVGFFFITFSISSNIVVIIGTSMAERLMYSPSLGFCIAIGFLINKFRKNANGSPSLKKFFVADPLPMFLTAVIVVLFSARTIARNTVWKNNTTLYTSDVKVSPNSTRTHYYLGNLMNKEDFLAGRSKPERDSITQASIDELKKSIEIYPPFTDAWNQLGVLYDKLKNRDESRKAYEQALRYNPNEPTVHNNIGTLFFEIQDYQEAAKAFQKAIDLNPNYIDAYNNLASAMGEMKQFDKAIEYFQYAIKLDPNNIPAHHYLGITYQMIGNQAMADFYLAKEKELTSK